MNNEEAIAGLQVEINIKKEEIKFNEEFFPRHDNSRLEEDIEVYETAISALEKQIPKKGIKEKITEGVNKGLHKFYCPICYEKGNLSNKCNVGDYCSDCGQAIDWSDSD